MNERAVIPANLFGTVPERFYADLGRVAMLAALLDQRLQDLYVQMHHTDQTEDAGSYGSQLIALCAKRLDVFSEDERDAVAGFFAAALDALHCRNAMLHSLWVFPTGAKYGWRYPRVRRGETSVIAEQDTRQLPQLIADLVALNEECTNVMAKVRHGEVS